MPESIPDWPALNSVGRPRRLHRHRAVGATPNYTITETVFSVRRLAAGIAFQTPTEVLTPPIPSATIELTVSIADDSGDLAISIESSSTSNDCLSSLLVEAIDGPTFALP